MNCSVCVIELQKSEEYRFGEGGRIASDKRGFMRTNLDTPRITLSPFECFSSVSPKFSYPSVHRLKIDALAPSFANKVVKDISIGYTTTIGVSASVSETHVRPNELGDCCVADRFKGSAVEKDQYHPT